VRLDIPAPDRTAAIATAIELLAGGRGARAEAEMVQRTVEREEEFGTAMGHGLALPHLRLADLHQPRMDFLRLKEGVDWNAPDGQPVRMVFFLLSPEGAVDVHVRIIATLAKGLSDPVLRTVLETSESSEEIEARLEEIFKEVGQG
jgi:mannitol/fructose-specific phosphotransferase system IIA component (Ntr-type)